MRGPAASNGPLRVGGGPSVSAAAPLIGPAIYVSARGIGTGATLATPTTWGRGIAAARRWIASGGAAPTVHVLDTDGPIWMAREAPSALVLDATLSGATIQAHAGHRPILSGGVDLTGTWTAIGGGVWEATYAGPVTHTPRQLYIGGKPAEFARTERHPVGWAVNLGGGGLWDGTITAPDSSYAAAAHPTDMRVAMTSSSALWRYAIVRVISIVGATVTCHPDDVAACVASWPDYGTAFSLDEIRHVEGLFEFVALREGSSAAHRDVNGSVTVRYRPRAGEDMSTASTILPVLDLDAHPLTIGGTKAAPAVGITISGFRVRHWSWGGVDGHGAINHGGDRMIRGASGVCDLSTEAPFYAMPGAVVMRWATGCAVTDCIAEHHGATGIVVDQGAHGCSIVGVVTAENAAGGKRAGDDIRTVDSSHPTDDATVIDGLTIANCVAIDNGREHLSVAQINGYYFRNSTLRNSIARNGTYGAIVIGRGTGNNDPAPTPSGSYPGASGFGIGFPAAALVPGGAPWTTPATATGGNTFARLVCDVALLETTFADGAAAYVNGDSRSETWTGCVAKNALVGSATYLDNGTSGVTFVDLATWGGVKSQTANPPAINCSFVNARLAYGGTVTSPRQPTVTESGTETTVGGWSAAGRAIADVAGLEAAYAALLYPELTSEHATAWSTSYVGLVTDYGPQLAITGRITYGSTGWKSAAGDPAPALVVDCGVLHDVQRIDLHLASDTASFVVEGSSTWDFAIATTLHTQGTTTIPWSRPVVIRAADRADVLGSFRFLRIRSTSGAQLQVLAFRAFARPHDAALLSGSIDYSARPAGPWQTSYDGKTLYVRGADFAYRNSVARAMAGAGTITAQAAAGVSLLGAATDGVAGLVVEGAYPSATGYLHPSTPGSAGSGDTYTPVTGPDGTTATADRVQVTSGGYSKYGTLTSTSGQKFTLTRWIKESPATPGGPWHGQISDGGYQHEQGSAAAAWTCLSYTHTSSTTGAITVQPFDTRAVTSPPAIPVTWPHAIDVYGGPVVGIVRAESLITVATAALVTTTLTDSAGYRRRVGGRCKPTFEIAVSFSSANMGTARYLLVDQDDATTWMRINTDRTITVSVAGTAITLPTSVPAWSVAAGQFAKAVTLAVDFGAGSPSGSVTIDGVTTSLGTGVGTHAALTTEKWWVLSNNGSDVCEGVLRKMEWRT